MERFWVEESWTGQKLQTHETPEIPRDPEGFCFREC